MKWAIEGCHYEALTDGGIDKALDFFYKSLIPKKKFKDLNHFELQHFFLHHQFEWFAVRKIPKCEKIDDSWKDFKEDTLGFQHVKFANQMTKDETELAYTQKSEKDKIEYNCNQPGIIEGKVVETHAVDETKPWAHQLNQLAIRKFKVETQDKSYS